MPPAVPALRSSCSPYSRPFLSATPPPAAPPQLPPPHRSSPMSVATTPSLRSSRLPRPPLVRSRAIRLHRPFHHWSDLYVLSFYRHAPHPNPLHRRPSAVLHGTLRHHGMPWRTPSLVAHHFFAPSDNLPVAAIIRHRAEDYAWLHRRPNPQLPNPLLSPIDITGGQHARP